MNRMIRSTLLLSSFLLMMGLSACSSTFKGNPAKNREKLLQTKACEACNLSSADLSKADLQGANLKGVSLTSANLSGANLQGADLSGAFLFGTNFSGANLEGAKLTNAQFGQTNFEGATLKGADLLGVKGADAILVSAATVMPDGKSPANVPPQPVAKKPTPKTPKATPSPTPVAIPPIGSLSTVCNGQGVAAALPYDKAALGQRPPKKYSRKQILTVFSRDANSASPAAYQPSDYDFNLDGKWQASINTEDVALVLCVDRKIKSKMLDTCEYKTVNISGQTYGEAMQFKLYGSEVSLTLREAKTGKVLEETTLVKEDPCPDNKQISSFDPKKREIVPTIEVFQKDVQTFLTPYFEF